MLFFFSLNLTRHDETVLRYENWLVTYPTEIRTHTESHSDRAKTPPSSVIKFSQPSTINETTERSDITAVLDAEWFWK